MNTKPTSQVSVRLPLTLVDELDAAAREECRTRNGQIKYLLWSALNRSKAERSAPVEHRDAGFSE